MGVEAACWAISSISAPRNSAISQRLAKDDLPIIHAHDGRQRLDLHVQLAQRWLPPSKVFSVSAPVSTSR